MKIGIIATHSFPIPYHTHTGDIVILDLARTLGEMGHQVSLYAPEGTISAKNVRVLPFKPSFGKFPPHSKDCEQDCFNKYAELLRQEDIIHDFSVYKTVSHYLQLEGKNNIICTLMGGPWSENYEIKNVTAWSKEHRYRIMRGATDYEGTSTPNLAIPGRAVKNVRVVHGGIDTDFYHPTYNKKDFFLWMNRWNPAKGYRMAINLAKHTRIPLIIAGEHPDNEMFDDARNCALEALDMAKGYSNIEFKWLPKDPDHHLAKLKLYQEAKALLYPIDFCEPFGLSQAEALACGTPIIGTNFGSVSEIVLNGITGFVRNNDILDLSTAISLIDQIDNKTCRNYAVRMFDRTVMATSYLKEYESIMG